MRLNRTLCWLAVFLIAAATVGYQNHVNAAGYQFVNFVASSFPFDPDNGSDADIPAPVRGLDGTAIAFDGYMIPLDYGNNGTNRFVIVPSFFDSRHGPPVEQQVVVQMPRGKRTEYVPERIRVYGTVQVHITKEDGYIISIFTATADSVQLCYGSKPPLRVFPFAASDGIVSALAIWGLACGLIGLRTRVSVNRRRVAGLCLVCGYDLRASQDRCPECGTAVSQKECSVP